MGDLRADDIVARKVVVDARAFECLVGADQCWSMNGRRCRSVPVVGTDQ